MILDIQLPTRIGDEVQKQGGLKLLEQINGKSYSSPSHIVGITEYEETLKESAKVFEESLLTIIQYDETNTKWEKRLQTKIEKLVEASMSSESSKYNNYIFDVGVVCALYDPELLSIIDIDANWTEVNLENDNITTYYTGFLNNNNNEKIKIVIANSPQMGMPAAGIAATKLINEFKPKYLFMTGITAGVAEKTNLGDVIIADNCWDYDNVKKVAEGEFPDYKPLRLEPDLNNLAHKVSRNKAYLSEVKNTWRGSKPNTELCVHIGDLASGGAVVSDPEIIRGLQSRARKLLGVEMEAYAIMLAANLSKNPQPKVMIIKSVCDFADSKKSDDYQSYAAYTSAKVFERIITQEISF